MRRRRQRTAVAALIILAVVTGCGDPISDKHIIDEPATVEPVVGSELGRVTLTQRAAERLGIETVEVWTNTGQLAVPSSSLWLDPKGSFWVYTNPEPLVYFRHEVVVEDDNGEVALLSIGPPSGTRIVSVGVSELYGTEVGVGK